MLWLHWLSGSNSLNTLFPNRCEGNERNVEFIKCILLNALKDDSVVTKKKSPLCLWNTNIDEPPLTIS